MNVNNIIIKKSFSFIRPAWLAVLCVVLWHDEGHSFDCFLSLVHFAGTLNAWPLAPTSFAAEVRLWNPLVGSYIRIHSHERDMLLSGLTTNLAHLKAPGDPKPAMTFPRRAGASLHVIFFWCLPFLHCVGVCTEETAWQGDGDVHIKRGPQAVFALTSIVWLPGEVRGSQQTPGLFAPVYQQGAVGMCPVQLLQMAPCLCLCGREPIAVILAGPMRSSFPVCSPSHLGSIRCSPSMLCRAVLSWRVQQSVHSSNN